MFQSFQTLIDFRRIVLSFVHIRWINVWTLNLLRLKLTFVFVLTDWSTFQ
ncbi:MAG: hypothetical protein ACTS41_01010 [Candidatus Hodgkinia cicadicola]